MGSLGEGRVKDRSSTPLVVTSHTFTGKCLIPKFSSLFQLTVLECASQNSSIGKGEGALSVVFSIPEFTDIFVPTGSGADAKTIMPGVLVITARTLGQTPRLSRTEQQHSKTQAQKHGELSHAESLIEFVAGGDSRR